MSFQDNILDISKLNLEGDFESQVKQLLMMVRLTRTQVENLQDLITDVERTLAFPWPGCVVHSFGSIVTGLGIATSDIDCFVSLPPWVKIESKLVYKAKAYLQGKPMLFTELTAIPMAKVPIVKFYHIPTDRHCDINFSSMAGVQNSKLLAYLLHVDPRALPLAVLVKYWSKVHNLTGTNLMPNYALTLLVVFYLQYLEILPSVHILQQYVQEYMVDDWNTAFDNRYYFSTDNILTLYQLLGGFFDYYACFDFENLIISTYLGCPIQTQKFAMFHTIPPEYSLYRYNLCHNVCRELRINTKMCVQDPFEHSRNCAVAVHKNLFDIVMKYFKKSAQLFYEEESGKYLKAILTIVYKKEDHIKNSQNRPHQQIQNKIKKDKHKNPQQVYQKIKKNVHMLYAQLKNRKN